MNNIIDNLEQSKMGNGSNNKLDYSMTNDQLIFYNKKKIKAYSSSSVYSVAGSKTLSFTISGKQWLDLASLRLGLKIKNTGNAALYKLTDLSQLFSNLKITINGVIVEEIGNYNRAATSFNFKKSDDDLKQTNILNNGVSVANLKATMTGTPYLVALNEVKDAYVNIESGFLNSSKLLPLIYLDHLKIELTLDSSTDNSCFNTNTFELYDARFEGLMYTLDNYVEEKYDQLIMNGKSLAFTYHNYHHFNQNINTNAGSYLFNISAYCLNNIEISFYQKTGDFATADGQRLNNMFFHESGAKNQIELNVAGEVIDKLETIAEMYLATTGRNPLNVSLTEYDTTKHVVKFDLLKSIETEVNKYNDFSGYRLQSGSLLIKFSTDKPVTGRTVVNGTTAPAADATTYSDRSTIMFVLAQTTSLLEISNVGVAVFV